MKWMTTLSEWVIAFGFVKSDYIHRLQSKAGPLKAMMTFHYQ